MQTTSKRWIAMAAGMAVAAGLLAGCGSNSESGANKAGSNASNTSDGGSERYDKPVTLKLLIDNQTSTEGIKAVTDEIEKRYNIKTEFDLRPGGGEGDNLVKTRLVSGEMDDLNFYNSGSLFKSLQPDKYFLDLSNEPFMANVLDSFKPTVSVDGKVYAGPSGSSQAGAWLYNKKVYADLGLSVPKTWDELKANNEKIKAAGKTAVIGSFKDSWTAQLILLADYYNVQAAAPSFADDFTNNKAKFASTAAALRGFEKLAEMKPYLNKDYLSTTYDQALKMLVDGTGVQYPMLTFALSNIYANYPDQIGNIGVFAQPGDSADKNGLTVWMPAAISIYKESKNIEAAKKWLNFFVTPEAMALMATKAKPEGPYVVKGATLPDDAYQGVKDMLPYFDNNATAPALEFLSPLKGPNLPQIAVEAGAGMKSPEDSAKAYDKDVEKQAKQLGIGGW
ncbi:MULTISPECIES: extracellular solute-binding protein [unclassified Paenibacillus]|uniref:ABC transporter substrate-binding protein n=1 Tax=unclassified Paenibacillus TaxID=185978 RepID=UPI000953AF51|nr:MULTISPECIES: extracellular solute-binding protein [unclassified Paenibacillus]ASS68617.1 extracellular solute-binding protein [Paenibacillus sp. RUD330]SIR64767.1 raffinose/stachyose/melibiose transport system substrate-binding protein [Paenibacillus sp. RU4X]SIR72690.1 raffinose/stachyose/melibiose transport system substrate-binding protein [Paenibacillus sp. RU4T]